MLQLTGSPSNAKTPLEGSEFTLKFLLAWLLANSAVTKVIFTCPSSKFISRFSCVGGGERSPTSLRTELETWRAGVCGLATTMSLSSMISIPLSCVQERRFILYQCNSLLLAAQLKTISDFKFHLSFSYRFRNLLCKVSNCRLLIDRDLQYRTKGVRKELEMRWIY